MMKSWDASNRPYTFRISRTSRSSRDQPVTTAVGDDGERLFAGLDRSVEICQRFDERFAGLKAFEVVNRRRTKTRKLD